MSCSSVSHPSPNDICLSESLASMSISSDCPETETEPGDDIEEYDSQSSPHSLTPITTTAESTHSNSPANSSHGCHSRNPSFDGDEGSDSPASTPSDSNSNSNGAASSQCGGQRGINEKRPSQYDNRRNLHVDNLPPMTEVEFRNLFLTFGPIARSRIVTDTITGLPAGYGFVMFENESDAVVALQSLHNTYLPNSTKPLRVTVKKPKTAKAWEREREKEIEKQKLLAHGPVNIQTIFVNTNLYVAGLPANWTKREMDEIFSQFGMILESRILLEKHSHVSKGVGFVRFQQLECCHQAIQALNGKPAPVPASLKLSGKGNVNVVNPNSNREESKQNLTVRFAVDKTAQALAVAQQTVMGTLNQQRNSNAQPNTALSHSHARSEMSSNVNNQKYFAVLNSGALSQSTPRSISPTAQSANPAINVHSTVNGAAYGTPMNAQHIQSYLAMQQHQLARVAALATVSGSNRPSFSASNAPSPTTFAFPPPPQPTADLSAYSLENALLLSQLNSPLTSSALSLNSLATALNPMNLSSFALTPASSSAALNQFYAGNSLSTFTPFANQVFV